jgi:ankyrin repeat protein
MDPVSLAAYSTSATNNARAIHAAIEEQARMFKDTKSSDTALIEDSRSITERIAGQLAKLAQLRLKPQDEAQVQMVFSGLLQIRGITSRARNRQDVLRALKQCRAQHDTLMQLLASHGLEDTVNPQTNDQVLETAPRPEELPGRLSSGTAVGVQSLPRYHLQTLVTPEVSDVDIIFVHGICGDARETWSAGTENSLFWPKDFLQQETGLRNCRLLTYGYDNSKYSKDGLGFDQITNDFADTLYEHRRVRQAQASQAKLRGFVLVAHSLGGLVVRAALIRSLNYILSDLSVAIIFFGTPHGFSSPVVKAAKFKAIISATATSRFSSEEIDTIAKTISADISTDTAESFQNLLENELCGMPMVSFFEEDCTLTDRGNLRLVESFSGLNSCHEKRRVLAGDHVTMCKFESREESGYSEFVREIRALVKQIICPDLSNWTSTAGELPKEASKVQIPKLHHPDNLVAVWDEADSHHQRTYSGETRKASISSKTTEDVEKFNMSEEYRRQRPLFEVPLAQWHPSQKENIEWGNWFTESLEFQEWLTKGNDKGLLIRGPSGCGKTMIAHSVLKSYQEKYIRQGQEHNICVIQLFFRSESPAGHDVCSILKALIAQILDLNESLIRHVTRIFGSEASDARLSEETLFTIFCTLAKDTCWTQVVLVADAIDECTTSENLVSGETRSAEGVDGIHSPHLRLVRCLMSIPSLRFVATLTQEEYGLPTSIFSCEPDTEEGMDVSINQIQPTDVQAFSYSVKELVVPKLQAFETAFIAFLKERIHDYQILEGNQKATEANSENSTHTSTHEPNLDLFLLCSTQKSFQAATITINYCRRLWNPSLSKGTAPRERFPNIAELQDRNVLYSKALGHAHRRVINAICYLPYLLEPVRPVDMEMILYLMASNPTDLEAACGDLERDLGEVVKECSFGLVYEDNAGLHICSDDLRRFCLSRATADGISVDLDCDEDAARRRACNVHLEMHFKIAKACLRLLRLDGRSKSRSKSHVESPKAAIPGLKYAEKYWSRHAHLAGPKAIELNSLIYQVQQSTNESASDGGANALTPNASTILHRLALDDLSFNISTMFSGSNPQLIVSPDDFSKTLDNVVLSSSLSTIRSLDRLARRKGSHTISESKTNRAIIFLVRSGEIEAIKKAIEGSDTALKEAFLKYAIQFQQSTIIRYIIEELNETHLRASEVLQAWKIAVSMRDQKIINLMAMKSTLFHKDSGLLIAANAANGDICEILLKRHANPNYADENHGKTALHIAAASGQVSLVKLLLRWRAQPAARDRKKRTPLHCATEYGHVDVVDFFLRTSTLREEVDRYKRTSLFIACAQGYKATVAHLWSSGSNLSHRDQRERTVLHAAAARGSSDVVRLLIDAGVPVDAVDSSKRTALHEASRQGYGVVVEMLLTAGASPFREDMYGLTPLHRACFTRMTPEIVARMLLDHGAAIDAKSKLKAPDPDPAEARSTPLHLAAYAGTVRLVKVLLDVPGAKATLFDNDSRGRTPLLCANDSMSSERAHKKRLLGILTNTRTLSAGRKGV